MTKRIGILMVVTFVLSVSVVFILYAVSKDMRQQPGSFLREFPPHPVLEAEVLDLKYNSYYIAGGTAHHIYLANHTAPLHMIVLNSVLGDSQHIKLNVKGIDNQKFWSTRVTVDSPYYYLTDGVVPIIYKGKVQDWKATEYAYDNVYFQDILPITKESFFIRSLSKPERENILGKITTTLPHLQVEKGILKKQIDGVFCTDGMMQYDRNRNELIYLYRYRNEYIVMDTSLNVLRKQHTIDTTTRANFKIETIASTGSTTFSSPARMVNRQSSVQNGRLFVNSRLLARNEHPEAHDSQTVIDVYDLATGQYQFSFYIYDLYGKEKLREFRVFGDRLYALFEQHIQVWNLRPKYFSENESSTP